MNKDEFVKVYKLIEPVQIGTEAITEIRFRKSKAKDNRILFGKKDITPIDIYDHAQLISDQSKAVFDELSSYDQQEIIVLASSFFQNGPRTGPTL